MNAVQSVLVENAEDGLRLDRWFRQRYPEVTHGRLEKLLRTGQVRVDGGRVKSNTRLVAGQTIRVPPLAVEPGGTATVKPARKTAFTLTDAQVAELRDRILFRTPDVLAFDKPAGLAVQGGTGTERHLDAMLDLLRFDANERPRLVHRLDKDTSGVILLARSAEAARWLTAAFRSKEALKVYWALVVGVPKIPAGRISLPIAKLPGRAGERMVPDEEEGKTAVTDYRIIGRALKRASWLALAPRTGRTHQLRVHCAAIETPILGDGKYGGAEAFLGGGNFARQLHLHARAIRMPLPDGRFLEVKAPVPDHMRRAMDWLGFEVDETIDPFGFFLSLDKK